MHELGPGKTNRSLWAHGMGTCSEDLGFKKEKKIELGSRRTMWKPEMNYMIKKILLKAGHGAVELAF